MTRFAQLLSIKQNETGAAFPFIGIMLFTSMGAALGGTGIEALFFARFGVEYLPYMYIGLGFVSMLTLFVIIGALGRVPRRVLYLALPLLTAALVVGARLALFTGANALYPVLWLGKEILNSVLTLVLWGMAGAVFDARQAKRLFPLFTASKIFGQVVGGFVTGALVAFVGAENLLVVWAGLLLLTFLLVRALLAGRAISAAPQVRSRRRQPSVVEEIRRGYRYVRGSPLLTWIAASTVLFSFLFFSIALPFSRAATEQFPNENSLAGFLGLFNGFSTAAAFLTSLFLANRLFSRIGIMACILAFPLIYFIGFGGLILAPVFAVIVAFRFVQMLWLSGIGEPAWQAMFSVVPAERREQVLSFTSVPSQAGIFIAGGILIVGEQALEPRQLYVIGLLTAALCTYVILKARRGYNASLVEALREGRPHLFFSGEKPFGGFQQDAAASRTALAGLRDADPKVRRASAEILGYLSLPDAEAALIGGLRDSDPSVRAACIRSLTRLGAAHYLLDIAASLSDPEPAVRLEAVSSLTALSPHSPALIQLLAPLLDDDHAEVSARAALSILRSSHSHAHFEQARGHLRRLAVFGNLEERTHAIHALGECGDREAFDFLANELRERQLEPLVKRAILASLAKINPQGSLPYLLESLKDPFTQETAAQLLGGIGVPAMEPVLAALEDDASADGALLALECLPAPPPNPILDFARTAVSRAGEYDALRRGTGSQVRNEAMSLLEESLREKSLQFSVRALRAIGLLGDRAAMTLAVENLRTQDANQRANVIEALEAIGSKHRSVFQPLTKLWEDETPLGESMNWDRLLADDDEWIRECAHYAAHQIGVKTMEHPATLSLMERILFFRRVPIFANLSPADLKQVAAIAYEETFSDGEVIAEQGETGDAMFVITSGEVRVCMAKDGVQSEVARRGVGNYVGEMAILNREPRSATLIAAGEVRALCMDRKSFEGLLRDRPDVSLNVIKELSRRLKEASERITQ
jgi:HEAT repeat protein